MSTLRIAFRLVLFSVAASATFPAVAADVAKVDRAFVGKVSQGGAYEVKAGQMAVAKAQSPAVKQFAMQDVADHEKVNAELKAIAASEGLPVAPTLAAPLQKKLDALDQLSGAAFDKAYVDAMATIHRKDEGIFAKEAKAGAGDAWKAFAAKTDEIVKGHIATLDTVQPGLH